MEYASPWTGFELTTLVVIGTDCTENRVWNGAKKELEQCGLLSAVFLIDLKEDAEKERTETSLDLWKTLTAKSSSTAVILCHRQVKSAIIKANEELKKQLETFIKENKFYYNDRFLEQNSINISQGNEAVT